MSTTSCWHFNEVSKPLKGKFRTDSVNADLHTFQLTYLGQDNLGFDLNISSIPDFVELELVINVKIWNGRGKTFLYISWKVAHMRTNDYVGLKCCRSVGLVANWQKVEVEIRSINRTPDSGKPPEAVLIEHKRLLIQPQPDANSEANPTSTPISAPVTPTYISTRSSNTPATVPPGKHPLTSANLNVTQPKVCQSQVPTNNAENPVQISCDHVKNTDATETPKISSLKAIVVASTQNVTQPIRNVQSTPVDTHIVRTCQSTANSISNAAEPTNGQPASVATDKQIGSDFQAQNGSFIHDMTGIITELLKSNHDETAIEQVYNVANIYDLSALKNSCEEKLIGQISVGSVCNSVKMAKLYGGDRLMAESLMFVQDNRGDRQLPWAQLMNLTDVDGNFLLDIVETTAEKTSFKRKRSETDSV